MSTYREIPLSSISAPQNPLRHAIDRQALDELAQSIAAIGMVQPLVVKPAPNGYEVVAGHRRLLAARQVGLAVVPAIVRDGDADATSAVMWAENLARQDLTPVEEARMIRYAIDHDGKSIDQVAERSNRSTAWVRGRLDLLTWPAFALEAVATGQATVAALKPLLDIENETERDRLLGIAISSGATAAVTRGWALQAAGMASDSPETMGARSQLIAPLNSVTVRMPCWGCRAEYDAVALAVVRICRQCIEDVQAQANAISQAPSATTA